MDLSPVFWTYSIPVILLVAIGLYCILETYNLVRVLIGIEVLMKAVTLLLILAGHLTGRYAQAQAIVITLIVIEVVLIVVIGGIIMRSYGHWGDLFVKNMRNLKG